MTILIFIITQCVKCLISAVLFFMLLRALLSLFGVDEDSALLNFLFLATEPVILPIRALFALFGWFEGFPIDVPFIVAFIALDIMQVFLI